MPDKPTEIEKVAVVQGDDLKRLARAQAKLEGQVSALVQGDRELAEDIAALDADLDELLEGMDADPADADDLDASKLLRLPHDARPSTAKPGLLASDLVLGGDVDDWASYAERADEYARRRGIDLQADPYEALLSPRQRIEIHQRIQADFTHKRCDCDKWEYAIAGCLGVIGGLIDAFFVGLPGQGALGRFSDRAVDETVKKIAGVLGWSPSERGSNPTKSAIAFLEKHFKVPYDHRHSGDVDWAFRMSTRNHHLKSLAHSPSPIGLLVSILDQFTDQATFVDKGSVIRVAHTKGGFKLQGSDLLSKLFCAFCNWFFHIVSDMAGSSGAAGRGSGVPIPFFEVFQFAEIGSFGEHQKTIARMAVEVFEKGYDLRHGGAMAIPVVLVELLIRFLFLMKRRFCDQRTWRDAAPFGNKPALRRMLVVGHGSLCLVDLTDAGIRSGLEPLHMLLRMNLVAWVRFGGLAWKEAHVLFREGQVDVARLDDAIDADLRRLLARG